MTTTDGETPIRISGPAGLLAVVPIDARLPSHQQPSADVRFRAVAGARSARLPGWTSPPGHDRAMAEPTSTNHALQPRRRSGGHLLPGLRGDGRPLLDDRAVREIAAGRHVDVMDAMVVRGGRVRPALNAAMERVTPRGIRCPMPNDPQVRQRSPPPVPWPAGRCSADREQLRRSIAGPKWSRDWPTRNATSTRRPPADVPPGHASPSASTTQPVAVPATDRPGPAARTAYADVTTSCGSDPSRATWTTCWNERVLQVSATGEVHGRGGDGCIRRDVHRPRWSGTQ